MKRGNDRRLAMGAALGLIAVLLGALPAGAQTVVPQPSASAPASATLNAVFNRMYNFDFPGAHRVLDLYAADHPDDPLAYSVRGAILLFSEFDRLHILDIEFFADDERVLDDSKAKPDPEMRKRIVAAIDETHRRAQARLAVNPDDRDALFASCMAANIVTDYTILVERRRWQGVGLERQGVAYANKLLALNPPVYDAYVTTGFAEYVVGSMPFFVRWFVHYDGVQGDKRVGIEKMKLVARNGRFYAPFARVLLAVASLRENKLEDARLWLAGLAADFPENPLFKRELQRVTDRIEQSRRTKR